MADPIHKIPKLELFDLTFGQDSTASIIISGKTKPKQTRPSKPVAERKVDWVSKRG